MAAPWPGGVRGLVADDRLVQAAIVVTIAAAIWFAVGPDAVQPFSVRAFTPPLAAMTAAGMWRIGADRRLPAASARFWLVLALAMCLFAAGMAVDFVARALDFALHEARTNAGETLLYPIAGLFAIVGFVVYPTALRTRMERIKIGLDIAIVLFAGATFVWYFYSLGGHRWQPADGWQKLADGFILPGLTLVAGFAVLRITLAGATVISRPTMICFVFCAAASGVSIFLDVDGYSGLGRFSSTLQVMGLAACVVGVEIQRRGAPVRPADRPAGAGWRRPFTVLPYAALAATMGLLLVLVGPHLDYRGWVVAVGVCALCAAVVVRQFASLWENSRLLSANRELTAELHRHANHDHLTGLANRAMFTERVVEALEGPVRPRRSVGAKVAVLLVDLDDFKIVNDSFGHQVGDELLVAVADRLRATIGPRDVLCRLGGDEFAILLDDVRGNTAQVRASGIVAALESPVRLSEASVRVAASVGIAMASRGDRAVTAVELLRNADVAMYAAKSDDAGGWRVFEPAMLTELVRGHELRIGLARALERGEIEVYYQPIVDLATGRVVGAEAQARWRRPGGRHLPQEEFVPLAEESGIIAEIDLHVLIKACRRAAVWRSGLGGGEPFDLHVNVSARHLHRPEFVVDVERALRMSGLPADCLTLEIAESVLAQHHAAAGKRLRALTRLGVHLAIDHFGSGYSSLPYLREIPAESIKIDKGFTEMLDEAARAPLAEAVLRIAATLGLRTLAEGIDRPEQARLLRDLGCRRGQGLVCGAPMTADDMGQVVARRALAYEVGAPSGI